MKNPLKQNLHLEFVNNMKNDSSIMIVDYLSLYNNGKKYSSADFTKLVNHIKELRKKYKNQNG